MYEHKREGIHFVVNPKSIGNENIVVEAYSSFW